MQVTHKYPYIGYWGTQYKYGQKYDDSSVYLSGNYTYPVTLNTALPSVSKLKFLVSIGTQYYTSLFNRYWYVYAYTSNGWEILQTITMPTYKDSGNTASISRYSASITVDIELTTKKNIIKMAAVPTSRLGSNVEWNASFNIREAVITETIPDAVLSDSDYFCGIQENRGGTLYTEPRKIEVNIGDKLTAATAVMLNIDGELVALPKMQQYNFVATKNEQSAIIAFTPKKTGKHIIDTNTLYAGSTNKSNAYFKVFDGGMNEIMTTYTTSATLELEAGKVYKMIIIDYPNETDLAQRVLKVYTT